MLFCLLFAHARYLRTRRGCAWPPRSVDYIAGNDMDSLLKHMVDMTGHRDHTMLDISVISAVQELAGAAQTRVLTIASVRGHRFVRARAVIRAGSAARMEAARDSTLGQPVGA